MITIGVTGSVGTGKSTVCRMFEKLGAIRLDADALAHEALEKGKGPYRRVLRHFGEEVLRRGGEIDRAKLAVRVFSDPRELKKLCQIVHPYVIGKMQRRIQELRRKDPAATLVAEVPLLFEVGLDSMFHATVTAWCDAATQLSRSRRKGMTAEQLRLRKQAQSPLSEKRSKADHRVDTRGNLKETARQVRAIWQKLHSGRHQESKWLKRQSR